MNNRKQFPLLDFFAPGFQRKQIPWEQAEEAYEEYAAQHGKDQSLERLAERGGFSAEEIIELLYARILRLQKQAK